VPAPVASFQFFSHGTKMGQKFFLHKNKKVCYYNIDTCSCGLSFPGKLAGLARRMLLYIRKTTKKILQNQSRSRLEEKKMILQNQSQVVSNVPSSIGFVK
jgi:hypothetical protein